jgi:hypothetical protein
LAAIWGVAEDEDRSQWYVVRCLFQTRRGPSWKPRADGLNEYEERVTLWNARSFEEAIERAESEAREYAATIEVEYLGLAQAFALDDDIDTPGDGREAFSLIRADPAEPAEYLDRFFDTGREIQQTMRYEQTRRDRP